MDNRDNYDFFYKIILAGDSFVGKTNLLKRNLKNEFDINSSKTVGVEFSTMRFDIKGHSIKAQIWDISGQETHKSIIAAIFEGAKGIIAVYDITEKRSLESIDKWVNEAKEYGGNKLSILCIGNKCDLENKRQITKEEGEEKARKIGALFFETSALTGENINKAFETMINEIYEKENKDSSQKEEKLVGYKLETKKEKSNQLLKMKIRKIFLVGLKKTKKMMKKKKMEK